MSGTLAIAVYDHAQGCAITGGQIYRGQKYTTLRGVYLYADYCSGRIWGLKRNGTEWQSALLLDTAPANISTFGDDEAGNVYLADHMTGDIYLVKTILSVLTTDLPDGRVGESYSATLRASGGKRPYTWSLTEGSLPDGLALDPGTGVISGVPTAYGVSSFTVRVEDLNLVTGKRNYSITIHPPPLEIQTESLPDALINQSYSQILLASGGRPPYTWTIVSGALPPGLSLNADGTISGIPTQQWKYDFTLQVTDTDNMKDSRALSISVVGASGTIEIALTLDLMDTGEYGYDYGTNLHESELTATFEGVPVDLVFSVTGYDIDYSDEVAVYLNGTPLGYLSKGPDNGLNKGDIFSIPATAQLSGENRIRFVQKTAGFTWGVTNILLTEYIGPPEVNLTVGDTDTGEYGYNYGSSEHETELKVTFEGTLEDLVFSVTGYDIDYSDEVAVYLNSNLLGYLSKGPNNGLNTGDRFPIPASNQLTEIGRATLREKV